MQVKTTISDSRWKISDSEADVFIRVIPEGYSSSVIYTVYNTTSGADYCSKLISLVKSIYLITAVSITVY